MNREEKTSAIPKASGWVRWIPAFREAWNTELFARLYRTSRMRGVTYPRLALVGGFIISLSISMTYMRALAEHEELDNAFAYVIVIPAAISLLVVFVRMLIATFITVPPRIENQVRKMADEGGGRSSIPRKDLALVNALAPILLGRNVIEEGFNFSFGYFVAGYWIYFLQLESSRYYQFSTHGINALYFMILYLQSMLILLLVMVLFSITGYLYDNGSRIAAFLLSAAQTGFAWMLSLIPVLMLPNFIGPASDERLMIIFLVMCAIQTGILLAFCGYALWTAIERQGE